MKKSWAFIVGFIILVGVSSIPMIVMISRQKNAAQQQSEDFNRNQRSHFLEDLQHRDRIDSTEEYEKIKQANVSRYKELKDTPQVIRGTIKTAGDVELSGPLRMSLRNDSKHVFNKTVVDDQMHFAFAEAEAGTYDVVLFETSAYPGVRLENVVVSERQPVGEIVIGMEEGVVEVVVTDQSGDPVKGAQVLVGKSSGGANPDLYTWRKGLTDAEGVYIGRNLTDGKYVVTVHTMERNGSTTISLFTDEERVVDVPLTHDSY
jgi:hypothetical protein